MNLNPLDPLWEDYKTAMDSLKVFKRAVKTEQPVYRKRLLQRTFLIKEVSFSKLKNLENSLSSSTRLCWNVPATMPRFSEKHSFHSNGTIPFMLATPLVTRRLSLVPLPVRQRVVPKPLPTMYDLPSELPGDPGLPDDYHIFQPQLLRETFRPPTHAPERVYVATDLNLYYDVEHFNRYKRPDWFAVLGVPRFMRLSYLIWQEQIPPFLAIELLSPGTEKEDLGKTSQKKNRPPTKWEVYEQWLQIPYYVVYSRYTEELQAFQLVDSRYRAIPLINNRLWFSELQLGLGLWPGEYQNERGRWLRWYDAHDEWITTVAQQRDLEAFRAREYAQLAQQAEQRAQAEADARLALEAELAKLKSQLKQR